MLENTEITHAMPEILFQSTVMYTNIHCCAMHKADINSQTNAISGPHQVDSKPQRISDTNWF